MYMGSRYNTVAAGRRALPVGGLAGLQLAGELLINYPVRTVASLSREGETQKRRRDKSCC